MSGLRIGFVVALGLTLGVSAGVHAEDESPAARWEAFGDHADSLLNRGASAARPLFAPAFWRHREGPRSMLREVGREGLRFEIVTVSVSDDAGRAVLQMNLMQGDDRADTIYMYAESPAGRERIVFIDESRCHERGYVGGTLPAAPPRGSDGPLCED